MKYALLLLIWAPLLAAGDSPCLIVKHASTSSQAFVSGANWRYVEGAFPKDMKWKSNITDRNIRHIKEEGGRVVIVPTDYRVSDLEDARKQCGGVLIDMHTAEPLPATAAK